MRRAVPLLTSFLLAAPALASETPQPAEDAAPKSQAPETVVTDTAATDDDPLGSYQQPEWTARRRFPTTRVYVMPSGSAALEYWLEVKTPFDHADQTRVRSLFELSLGIAKRVQVDLYLRTESDGGGPLELESERVELRWALADWGVIPGNPTLYLEWIRPHAGPWKGEVKLLLGGAITKGTHWGVNFSWEKELWDKMSGEYALTAAISRTLVDRKLSLGAEVKLELVDQKPRFGEFTGVELLVGPSLRWYPISRVSMALVVLFGAEAERDDASVPLRPFAPLMQPTLVFSASL